MRSLAYIHTYIPLLDLPITLSFARSLAGTWSLAPSLSLHLSLSISLAPSLSLPLSRSIPRARALCLAVSRTRALSLTVSRALSRALSPCFFLHVQAITDCKVEPRKGETVLTCSLDKTARLTRIASNNHICTWTLPVCVCIRVRVRVHVLARVRVHVLARVPARAGARVRAYGLRVCVGVLVRVRVFTRTLAVRAVYAIIVFVPGPCR